MNKNQAAQALGSLGGRSKSAAKADAARANAAKARKALAKRREDDAARVAAMIGGDR